MMEIKRGQRTPNGKMKTREHLDIICGEGSVVLWKFAKRLHVTGRREGGGVLSWGELYRDGRDGKLGIREVD